MRKIVKLVAAALVVAITFANTGTSAYAYYVTPGDFKNITYTPTYYFESAKVLEISETLIDSTYERTGDPIKLYYKKINGSISLGNRIGSYRWYKGAAYKTDLRRMLSGQMPNHLPEAIQFLDANGNPLRGTKNPIIAEINPSTGDYDFQVSDNALFHGAYIDRKVLKAKGNPGYYRYSVDYIIPDFAVMDGYEVKLGNLKPLDSSVYSKSFYQYFYTDNPIDPDVTTYTEGNVVFDVPFSMKGQTLDLTLNGIKIGTIDVYSGR